MHPSLKWIAWILFILALINGSGCQRQRDIATLETSGGKAIISCRWPCEWGTIPGEWLAFGPGMKVAVGDRLHVDDDDLSYVELRDQRSQIILGPDTMIVLEQLSTDPQVTQSRLRLDYGDIYAAANVALDQGHLEVETPIGTASLDETATDSAMIVEVQEQGNNIQITCLQGRVIIEHGNDITVLSPGAALSIDQKQHIQQIQAFEGQPPGSEPDFWGIVEQVSTAD